MKFKIKYLSFKGKILVGFLGGSRNRRVGLHNAVVSPAINIRNKEATSGSNPQRLKTVRIGNRH